VEGSMTTDLDRSLQNVLRMHLPSVEGDAPVPMDVPLAELGLDSLRAVSLVLDLEDTFEIEFPDQMLNEATFHTGQALRDVLQTVVEADAAE